MRPFKSKLLIVGGSAMCLMLLITAAASCFALLVRLPTLPLKEPLYSKEEDIEKTFPSRPSPRVEVDAIWGEVKVAAGPSGMITSKVVKRVRDRDKSKLPERLINIQQVMEQALGTNGDIIRIKTSYADEKLGGAADVHLKVPSGSVLDVQGGASFEMVASVSWVRVKHAN